MSTITFQCNSCEADFDVNITQLLERPTAIKCSHCGARPSSNRCHSFAQALDDLLTAMAALRSKVQFELNLDNDELPPPYGPSDDEGGGALGLVRSGDDDEDEEDEDDEDFDDEDDDDEDFDDDDFEFDDDEEEEDFDDDDDDSF
ncbi:MAG: hypothetical protein RMA76_33070 [Deltaproteobacteria bacterium]|jgi:predicted Zn finger-like uncharacterized protein